MLNHQNDATSQFFEKITRGDLGAVKQLYSKDNRLIKTRMMSISQHRLQTEFKGREEEVLISPLKEAASNNHADIFFYLLPFSEAKAVDALTLFGTAEPKILTYLIKRGKDPNEYRRLYDDVYSTPLNHAIQCKTLVAVKCLVQHGADVNNPKGGYPLHTAIHKPEIAVFLINEGADVNVKSGYYYRPPLHSVAASGDLKLAQALIAHFADKNAQDKFGRTPLHSAVLEKRVDMVNYLI